MGLSMIWIRNFLHLKPKISIIIPFYNSEKYILRCMESIALHTEIPHEIICVNDGSTDNSAAIVRRFKLTHPQIKLINLKANKGLYQARLCGMTKARGEYIGFVDSDDYVSDGYFDLLYESAIGSKSDIAVGQIVNVNSDGVKYVQSRCERFPYVSEDVDDMDVCSLYWKQQGRCYHWHVVWNKIYKKSLIRDNLDLLNKQTKHLVMLEDFIFSSFILEKVKSYSVCVQAKYFYVNHRNAATKTENYTAVLKNIDDMKNAFDFVEEFLMQNLVDEHRLNDFLEWKRRYCRYWKRNILAMGLAEKQQLINNLEGMLGENIGEVTTDDEFYYEKSYLLDII